MNVAGEPSTGNLYTRFDEGRGGQAYGLAPSSTLPAVDYKFERSTLSGWEGMAQGGIDRIECPGSHLTMFESPNVETLVASAQRTIDNAVVAAGLET